MSSRHAVENEGAEVAEGSQDIRTEAGECPVRAYCVLIRAMTIYLCDSTKNSDLLSYDGDFLQSFRNR